MEIPSRQFTYEEVMAFKLRRRSDAEIKQMELLEKIREHKRLMSSESPQMCVVSPDVAHEKKDHPWDPFFLYLIWCGPFSIAYVIAASEKRVLFNWSYYLIGLALFGVALFVLAYIVRPLFVAAFWAARSGVDRATKFSVMTMKKAVRNIIDIPLHVKRLVQRMRACVVKIDQWSREP